MFKTILNVCALALPFCLCAAEKYQVTELTALNVSNVELEPQAMNDLGQIAGEGYSIGDKTHFAFVLSPEKELERIVSVTGEDDEVDVFWINNQGAIIGNVCKSHGDEEVATPFVWKSEGGTQYFENKKGEKRFGFSTLNNKGETAGGYLNEGNLPVSSVIRDALGNEVAFDGFEQGIMPFFINDQGQVLGLIIDSSMNMKVCACENGNCQYPQIDAPCLLPNGANQKGDVLIVALQGSLMNLEENVWATSVLYLWNPRKATHEKVIDLGSSQYKQIEVGQLNDNQEIVGTLYRGENDEDPFAFIWDREHGVRDLNACIDQLPEDAELIYACAINNKGEILAKASRDSGGSFFVLLKPVSE